MRVKTIGVGGVNNGRTISYSSLNNGGHEHRGVSSPHMQGTIREREVNGQ